jgi:hypothetical protein
MGLIVEKSAVLHGHTRAPDVMLGSVEDNQREIIENLRRRIGSDKFEKVLEFLTDARLVKQEPIEADNDDDE